MSIYNASPTRLWCKILSQLCSRRLASSNLMHVLHQSSCLHSSFNALLHWCEVCRDVYKHDGVRMVCTIPFHWAMRGLGIIWHCHRVSATNASRIYNLSLSGIEEHTGDRWPWNLKLMCDHVWDAFFIYALLVFAGPVAQTEKKDRNQTEHNWTIGCGYVIWELIQLPVALLFKYSKTNKRLVTIGCDWSFNCIYYILYIQLKVQYKNLM